MRCLTAVFVLVLSLAFLEMNAALSIKSMPSPCTNGKTSTFNVGSAYSSGSDSSGILHLVHSDMGANCSVRLVTFGDSRIVITVKELNISSANNKIKITDGYTSAQIDGNYFKTNLAVYTSQRSGANVTVSYKAGSSVVNGGFQLIYTAFYDDYCSSTYRCDNGKCIAKVFECDGYNHCGDSSYLDCGPTTGRIIRNVFIGIFVLVAIAGVVILVVRQRRKDAERGPVIQPLSTLYPPASEYPPTIWQHPPPKIARR